MKQMMHLRSRKSRGKGTIAVPVVALGLYLLSPAMSRNLEPNTYVGGYTMNTLESRNSNAFAILLGEIRANASDLMFIKTERYLDSGIAYMPHVTLESDRKDAEQEATTAEHEEEGHDHGHEDEHDHAHDHDHEEEHDPAHEDEHDHEHGDHAGTPTIIPAPPDDFRGFIGWLHREVKPWRDPSLPHQHTAGDELLPWYRVMTISNPNNVRAYLIGAWWLKSKQGHFQEEAIKFLEEGIEFNPDAFQLYLMKGYVNVARENQEEAWKSFLVAADLAMKQRPAGGPTETSQWTDYQEEDARASARLAVFFERQLGDPTKALEMAKRFNGQLEGDGRLKVAISEMTSE
jgi:tetratricopeptide (TPR) repeat protein